jgi:hypothetical protein
MPTTIGSIFGAKGIQRKGRLPIAASQTFRSGDFLTVNSSGQVQQAATAGTGSGSSGQVSAWTSGITNLIVGRAMEDAQPQPNDPTIIPSTKLFAEFVIAEPGTWFEVPIYHATASSAYPSPAQIGVAYELWNLNGSTASFATGFNAPPNQYYIRIDQSTAVKAQICDFNPAYYSGWPDVGQASAPSSGTFSQYATAYVEFLGGACLLSGARPITRTN